MSDILEVIFFVICCCLLVAAVCYSKKEKNEQLEKARLKKRDETIKKVTEERKHENARAKKYKELFEDLKPSPDSISKILYVRGGDKYTLRKQIVIFPNEKIIYIHNRKFAFSDIINCQMVDEVTTKKGSTTFVTKSNTGSMIRRSIAGGLLFGETGAIIGGTTGSKNTEINQSDDIVSHSYSVKITVNDIMTPMITINYESKKVRAEELYNTFIVIISNNKKNTTV